MCLPSKPKHVHPAYHAVPRNPLHNGWCPEAQDNATDQALDAIIIINIMVIAILVIIITY